MKYECAKLCVKWIVRFLKLGIEKNCRKGINKQANEKKKANTNRIKEKISSVNEFVSSKISQFQRIEKIKGEKKKKHHDKCLCVFWNCAPPAAAIPNQPKAAGLYLFFQTVSNRCVTEINKHKNMYHQLRLH